MQRFNLFNRIASFSTLRFLGLGVCIAIVASSFTQTSTAQTPRKNRIKHQQIRSDLAPGVAAFRAQMRDPKLVGHVQPVRIVSPFGSRISIWYGRAFSPSGSNEATYGMTIGPVYRLKVEDIPNQQGKQIFPSIEVVNRLQPPEGLEQKFPIEIVLTEDDLREAIAGRFVTKVIYLEDPEMAAPVRQLKDDQRYFDVAPGEDAYHTAKSLGRPMAIVKIGSRAPIAGDSNEQFGFDNPTPEILSAVAVPKIIQPRSKNWESLDGDLVDPPLPPKSSQLPPIIPGEIYNGGN